MHAAAYIYQYESLTKFIIFYQTSMCLSPLNFQPASLPVIDKFKRHCQCKKFIFPKFIGHYILWYSFNIGLLILKYKGPYSQTELPDGSWQLTFPLSYLEPYSKDWLFIDLKLRGSLILENMIEVTWLFQPPLGNYKVLLPVP